MHTLPMTFRRIGALISGLAVILIGTVLLFFSESEVGAPAGWPGSVKLYWTKFRGETRAVDAETGQTLFMYLPEYDMHVHPVSIQKIDSNHWQVVFEDPTKHQRIERACISREQAC